MFNNKTYLEGDFLEKGKYFFYDNVKSNSKPQAGSVLLTKPINYCTLSPVYIIESIWLPVTL